MTRSSRWKIKHLSWAMLPREGTWGSLNGTDPQKLIESALLGGMTLLK